MKEEKYPGIVIIPDESNGPSGPKRPEGCHCHCAMVFGIEHIHLGNGGWWINGDCKICNSY